MSLQEIIDTSKELLTDKEAAEFLTTTPGTLSVWRSTGRYALPFVKIGRMVRYRRADLIAWLEKRSRTTGATA
ncbi:helix-turn-helix domain-containing protein [Aromatoleum anaerobium]|uniref:Helix-turn-helix domain-containing protein n=2 Tax=Aromatoleum TaxID=551759 RepID=A0ABX1PPC0_9RHOO|nr:helix-turn-helix domain-containing protein [Aromatoleum anaerobium]MCK0506328.1 helix-turn-helix domain-containing protein [Aromatoleum anaerobium]